MADNNIIRFTPYQFMGVIVMFMGLIATAIGPYFAVKADISNLNVKFAEIDLKLTTYLSKEKDDHILLDKRINVLEIDYDHIQDILIANKFINPSDLKK